MSLAALSNHILEANDIPLPGTLEWEIEALNGVMEHAAGLSPETGREARERLMEIARNGR